MKLIQPDQLDLAVDAITRGDLVVMPTRRWYMICADARNTDACDRIYRGKGRRRSKPLAYVLADVGLADKLFTLSSYARLLAAAFWPGDLALILPWRDSIVGQQHASVGAPHALVTMDPGPMGELARRSPVPVAATTANLSEVPSPEAPGPAITTAEVRKFAESSGIDIAYCVEGGIAPLAQHLTIVDCTATPAQIVRSGVVHERAIRAAIAGG